MSIVGRRSVSRRVCYWRFHCIVQSIQHAHPDFQCVTMIIFSVCRSRSHSSDSSFEDDFGVRKEVLLHGTYDDYIKEYKSRSGGVSGGSSSKGQPSMADVAAAYQKALTQVASALQHQGSSSKVGTMHMIVCIHVYMYMRLATQAGFAINLCSNRVEGGHGSTRLRLACIRPCKHPVNILQLLLVLFLDLIFSVSFP